MLFGSTGRFGCANPTPMWEFWDSIGINQTDMIGWWDPLNPVTLTGTTDPFAGDQNTVRIHASSYRTPLVWTKHICDACHVFV
jgi:hypothetical protein